MSSHLPPASASNPNETSVPGHFYFTELLVPALEKGAQSMPDKHARIVHTSSSAAYLETLHYETFRAHPNRKKLGPRGLYSQSKFVRALFHSVQRMPSRLITVCPRETSS